MTPMRCHRERCMGARPGVRIGAMGLVVMMLMPPSLAYGMQGSTAFAIVGSQFHQRDQEDAGEARICIQNTGEQSISMTQLKIRVPSQRDASPDTPLTECQCVFAKLSPPILRPGQFGEVVAKLMDRPMGGCQLTCNLSAEDGATSQAVSLAESPLWISFVGFSEDLRRVFVYVENLGSEPIESQLLCVGQYDMADRAKAIHSFFVVMEGGNGDPRLGLEAQWPFVQTMACPAHGSHEEAAVEFLTDYVQRFSRDPSHVIQMHLCRSDMTRAWFRFGDLPDVAVMNTCLRPLSNYDKDPQRWFCPFFCTGALAKKVTEPGRNVALIHTGPDAEDEGSFLHKELTSQEWRFLVCCAVTSGAKGVIYRGFPKDDPLVRDAFHQLNRELQHLKSFLLIAEPVEWTTAEGSSYVAKSLLG